MDIPEEIRLGSGYYLAHTPTMNDIDALIRNANDEVVYQNLLKMPKLYTREHAESYVNGCQKLKETHGRPMKWQVRDPEGSFAGSITLHNMFGSDSHRDEIGYWLGRDHRGRGIMTEAMTAFASLVFEYYGLARLDATIFDFNIASQKMVEKCGFIYEGTLKKAYFKDGKYIDGKLYALVK